MKLKNQPTLTMLVTFFIVCSFWLLFAATVQAVEADSDVEADSIDNALEEFSDEPQPMLFSYSTTPCPFYYVTTTGTIGTKLNMYGNNFGNKEGNVFIGEKKCKVLYWSSSMIMAQITEAITRPGTYDITVVPRKNGSAPLVCQEGFEMMAPEIGYIRSVTDECDYFYMVGKYFGTSSRMRIYFRDTNTTPRKAKILGWGMNYDTNESLCFFNIDLAPGLYTVQVENKVGVSAPIEIMVTDSCEILPPE
jgi:hypothetical protein